MYKSSLQKNCQYSNKSKGYCYCFCANTFHNFHPNFKAFWFISTFFSSTDKLVRKSAIFFLSRSWYILARLTLINCEFSFEFIRLIRTNTKVRRSDEHIVSHFGNFSVCSRDCIAFQFIEVSHFFSSYFAFSF